MADIIQIEHGNYVIKAGSLGGTAVARAFPRPPSKNKGVIAEARGKNPQEAIETLKAQIDTAQTEREETRRPDEATGLRVPLADEYAEALRQTHLSAAQAAMLKLHALAGDGGMTLPALADAAGYHSTQVGTSLYAKAARAVAGFLRVEIPSAVTGEGEEPVAILARPEAPESAGAQPVWVMHPEVREAVDRAL